MGSITRMDQKAKTTLKIVRTCPGFSLQLRAHNPFFQIYRPVILKIDLFHFNPPTEPNYSLELVYSNNLIFTLYKASLHGAVIKLQARGTGGGGGVNIIFSHM